MVAGVRSSCIAMANARQVRCYDYVNQTYEKVRDALSGDVAALFQAATHAASRRAHDVAVGLRVDVAGVEVVKDVVVTVKGRKESAVGARKTPTTKIGLEWKAADTPRLFPVMKGELSLYPLTATETQLDFDGHYEPPLGSFGRAVNALVGHRIAEASVHRFLADVAAHLRKTIGKKEL
jgi:hypothetical protein